MAGVIAIGVGCRKACASAAIVALVRRALAEAGAREGVRGLFTIDDKRGEANSTEAARALGLELNFLAFDQLEREAPRVATRSARVERHIGTAVASRDGGARGGGGGRRTDRGAPGRRWRDLRDRLQFGCFAMTVHFIGAGPGAADLITLRGRDRIARCPVCLYAGSLIPKALLAHCPEGARIIDTASLDLDAIIAHCVEAHARGRGCRAAAFGRSVHLERAGRADAPARRVEDSLYDHARRARLRRGRGGAWARTDPAGGRAIRRADPHRRARFGDAAGRDLARLRGDRRDAGGASFDPCVGKRRRDVAAVLRRRVPLRRRRARVLAGRANREGATGRPRRGDGGEPGRAHGAEFSVGPALGAEDFRESALYDADYVRRFRGGAVARE